MKIIKKGNVYKKAGWWKENEYDICKMMCFVLFILNLVMIRLIFW
jgi:hypothetical protein